MNERFIWKEGDALIFESQCDVCKHKGANLTCAAFLTIIPGEIQTNEHDHRKAYPGDQGIRFEAEAL